MGLGLSICKEIVQLHNGVLEVEDNPGGGTIFKAWFPADSEISRACESKAGNVSACR